MTKEERQIKRAAAEEARRKKEQQKLEAERERLTSMWRSQKELAGETRFVFGIDEAGRGPLCGPVVAACCILPPDVEILFLNDSKKLSEAKREKLYEEIVHEALSFGIGIVGPERIDEINILQATFEAMREAFGECIALYHNRHIEGIQQRGEELSMNVLDDIPSAGDSVILVDGDKMIPGLEFRQRAVIGGDALFPSVSAASILAKVTRDRILLEYDRAYPLYGFAQHKGYGTKQHMEAIRAYGLLPIHRRSFVKGIIDP